ncbi:MAG TPA: polysaccharide pyruvyl transferase family protein [Rhizomicrobium sp.]|nr:polysaccharide pyruvyl transferase family protein [Rhizomicrobium sp.]
MKFGLFTYRTRNIGDVIQSMAAAQFLPSVDCLIDRDRLSDATEACKIIFNGWFTHRPQNWPPAPALDALLISMHLSNEVSPKSEGLRPADVLLSGENLEWFKAHAPIGARDLWTRDLLRAKGVDSYFSGCLTLTLGTGETRARRDYVCAVNLNGRMRAAVERRTGSPVVVRSHNGHKGSFEERVAVASDLLSLYAHAKCVITTKLHCALPCLALGTPVLLVTAASDSYRFSGLLDLVHHCDEHAVLDGTSDFDVARPPPNPIAYQDLRTNLIRKTTAFVDRVSSPAARKPFRPSEAPVF